MSLQNEMRIKWNKVSEIPISFFKKKNLFWCSFLKYCPNIVGGWERVTGVQGFGVGEDKEVNQDE